MSIDSKGIKFEVVVIRNQLLRGMSSDETKHRLDAMLAEIRSASSMPFLHSWEMGLQSALEQVDAGNLGAAAVQLNVIHNLPLSPSELDSWDRDHFFKIEIGNLTDRAETTMIARMIMAIGVDLWHLEHDES